MNGQNGGGACVYGDPSAPVTIALFGDSHALAWFPAVQQVAKDRGWRLVNVTMSTCWPAAIPIWVSAWERLSSECTSWREQAIAKLVALKPTIVLVTGSRWFATTDP